MFEEMMKKKDQLVALCREHHVRHLAVFGSAIRDDFDPDRSDVDFRVEFGEIPVEAYAQNKFALQNALELLFGRRVDLLTATTIRNCYLRAEIESTQETLYAA